MCLSLRIKLCLPTLNLLNRENRFCAHQISRNVFIDFALIQKTLLDGTTLSLCLRSLTYHIISPFGFHTWYEMIRVNIIIGASGIDCVEDTFGSVSYTHLTLPTKRIV